MPPKGAFSTYLFILTSQYYSYVLGKQADRTSEGHTVNLLEPFG